MGQIKKLDVVGFESRVDSHSLNMTHFDTFLKADKALVEADAILAECGIEGITPVGYESRAEKIGKLGEDASLLLKYPDELIDGLLAVDANFAKGVQKATEALSTIRIDDIRIKNTFDTEIFGQSENQETSESTLKEYLTMEDVVRSFDELSPQETSFVKEFTDLLYAPYATKNIALDEMVTEKEDELQELLNGSDHDADKYHPAKEFLREILGVLTSGNYSSSIATMGYDPITKDVFSEEGRKALALSRTPQALKFAFTFGADTKLDELIAYISKPQGGMASLSSTNAYEAMTVSRLEMYLLAATSGVTAGYSMAKSGISCLDFYQKNRQTIIQDIAMKTAEKSFTVSKNIENSIEEIARKTGAKIEEIKQIVLGYIPQNVSNETVIDVMEFISDNFFIPIWKINRNLGNNSTMISEKLYKTGNYIENQEFWGEIKYGFKDMAFSGCEIIAVINALHSLGDDMSEEDVVDLISYFEEKGSVFAGVWGTSPMALVDYLSEEGYGVEYTTTTDYSEIEKLGERSDTIIVTLYNEKDDILQQIHTINIEKGLDAKGKVVYIGHNTFYYDDEHGDKDNEPDNNEMIQSKPYYSLEEAIRDASHDNNSAPIMVIGINKPRIGDFPESEAKA